MTKHIHVIVNANSVLKNAIPIKNGIIKHVNVNLKIILHVKMVIVRILAHVFVRRASAILFSIADTSVIECDEIIFVIDILSIKKTNAIAANVISSASMNCYNKKVRKYYILHKVL